MHAFEYLYFVTLNYVGFIFVIDDAEEDKKLPETEVVQILIRKAQFKPDSFKKRLEGSIINMNYM